MTKSIAISHAGYERLRQRARRVGLSISGLLESNRLVILSPGQALRVTSMAAACGLDVDAWADGVFEGYPAIEREEAQG